MTTDNIYSNYNIVWLDETNINIQPFFQKKKYIYKYTTGRVY